MDARKTILISTFVFLGLGIAGFVGYKIYRTTRTKSGNEQKNSRRFKVERRAE